MHLLKTPLIQTCLVQTPFPRRACNQASSLARVSAFSRAAHHQMICRMCAASSSKQHPQIPDASQKWLHYVCPGGPPIATSGPQVLARASQSKHYTSTVAASPCYRTNKPNGMTMCGWHQPLQQPSDLIKQMQTHPGLTITLTGKAGQSRWGTIVPRHPSKQTDGGAYASCVHVSGQASRTMFLHLFTSCCSTQ